MKSAKVLIPILVVVLLVCMMALTFAWFAETMEEARLENIFRVGQAAQVVLSDDGGALIGAKYNGQLGFTEDGTPYPDGDPDETYVAEYHIGVTMLGSSDMALRVVPDGLVIILDEYASTASAAYLIANVISDFDGYDPSASHIGAAAQDPDGGLEFSDPTDGSEPFLYTDDGTVNGEPLAVRLDPVNAAKYFAVEIAKFDGTEHGALSETVVFDYESGEVSTSPDAAVQITLCIRISYGYASADGAGEPFPFADNAFRASTFEFTVTASAEAV